ncbi:rifin [Plasmodium reichenowi]|uniref:Rifin n=1 Tax=Plasmodium reichenowi TaxID=5854 RepID=A0A060RTZ2_PLARE|nr:rifin [Plasmodium reichenowi]
MKVHYINILLFALPLNILLTIYLVNTHKNPSITHHTPTTRLLCECDLYMPNYDNDPQIKEVMEIFNKQTQQRFHEYDEKMKTTRQKCKDQCNKEIQKIILKDKLEKELMDKFATLQTDIQNDAIPTCICEKSIADKTEKFCLNCGKNMGAIAPWWGLVCGAGYAGWTNYAATTLLEIANDAGIKAGIKWGIQELKDFHGLGKLIKFSKIKSSITPTNYADPTTYVTFVEKAKISICDAGLNSTKPFCNAAKHQLTQTFSQRASRIAEEAADIAELAKKGVLEEGASSTSSLTTAITASVIAIVVIVLIMVIIYLILRYRRKKKMKKKLQYIKLLKE